MLDILIHVWSKQSKTAIACLSLAPLAIGCAAVDVLDPPPYRAGNLMAATVGAGDGTKGRDRRI